MSRPPVKWPRFLVASLVLVIAAGGTLGLAVRYHSRLRPLRQHLYSGIESFHQGDLLNAEREWKEALRLDDRYWQAWKMLGEYYVTTERWDGALEAWSRVHEIAPNEPHVMCRLATAEWMVGDERQAFASAEQELRRAPQCVDALGLAAQLAEVAGDQKRAVAYLRRAVHVRPDDSSLLFRFAMSLLASNQRLEARQVVERIVKLTPDSPDAQGLMGLCLLDDPDIPQHLQRAEKHLTRALALEPHHPDALLAMGRLALQRGRPRDAVRHLEGAAAASSTRQRVFFELARAYEQTGQSDRATQAQKRFLQLKEAAVKEEKLTKLCAIAPNDFQSHLELGRMKLRGGDLRRAEYYLRQALDLKPQDDEARKTWQSLESTIARFKARPAAH